MKKQKVLSIFDIYDKESPIATEFRRIYSNLKYYTLGEKLSSFLVTSPMMQEGKSTVVSFLAISIADWSRKNVIVLDCDLRRPSIHQFFNLNRDKGMTDILLGKKDYHDCIKRTSLENLALITSGAIVDFPTELLESQTFRDLLVKIKSHYDIIIADCAPVILVNDALVLGGLLDGAIVVLKAGYTQRDVARRAIELLKNAKVNLLGVTVNNMEDAFPYYYNYRYYGYDYGYRKRS